MSFNEKKWYIIKYGKKIKDSIEIIDNKQIRTIIYLYENDYYMVVYSDDLQQCFFMI